MQVHIYNDLYSQKGRLSACLKCVIDTGVSRTIAITTTLGLCG